MFRRLSNLDSFLSLWDKLRDPLYRNAFLLMLISVMSGLTGLIFWLIVARYYPSELLGVSASLIALAAFLGSLSSLGLGAGLIRFLPSQSTGRRQRINASLTLAGLTAVVAGLLGLAGLNLWPSATTFGATGGTNALIFLSFTFGFALTPIVDSSFLASRKASYVLYRSVIYNGLRIPLLALLAVSAGAFGIFLSMGLALLVALVFGILILMPRLYPGFQPAPSFRISRIRDMVKFSTGNHVASLLYGLPAGLLPWLVLSQQSGSDAAYFYIAWIMASLLFLIPMSSAGSLFIEGSHPETPFATDAVRSLRFGLFLLIPAVLTLYFAGPLLLGLFGVEYSREGLDLLRILGLSAFFVTINSTYFSYLRVSKKVAEIILLSLGLGVGTVVASYLLLDGFGLLGPGLAFLSAQVTVSGYVILRHLPTSRAMARAMIRF